MIGPSQHHKQRSGVDAAVIASERDLFQGRHFSLASFMDDFPRLGIVLRTHLGGLRCGKKSKNSASEWRPYPQSLECGDDRITPESSTKPRNPCVRVGPLVSLGHHHVKVRGRTIPPIIELFIPRKNLRLLLLFVLERLHIL